MLPEPVSSSNYKFLTVSYPAETICHCQLSRPPVNALNTELWRELLSLLTSLEKTFPKSTRVLIFSSAARGPIFSAGNDLTELHAPSTSKERFYTFWGLSTLFLARLYKSPLYTIAAIRGATPAGGCVLSLCCDYRVALENTRIGLNEVAIGLTVPKYYALLLLNLCTVRSEAELLLSRGQMIDARKAKRLGLVDDVLAGNSKQLISFALSTAENFSDERGASGRAGTKIEIRRQFADDWEGYANEEAQKGWVRLCEPDVVKSLGSVLSKLKTHRARI
ncbi:unnamed protein product [Agarophyton chilense]